MSIEQRLDTIALEKIAGKMTDNGDENLRIFNNEKTNLASRILKDTKELSSLLNSHTAMYQVDDETIYSLINAADKGIIKDNHSKKILEALVDDSLSDTQLLEYLSTTGDSGNFEKLFNKDLENIINRGLVNTDHITHMQNISQLKPAGFLPETTNVMEVRDIIKRESIKEVMLRETATGLNNEGRSIFNNKGIEHLEDILQLDTLTKEQSRNLRYVSN